MSKITLTNLVNLQNETTAVNAINANNAVLTAALDNSLSRDGSPPDQMGASLDMNSNRIINLPQAVGDQDPVRLVEFNRALFNASTVTMSMGLSNFLTFETRQAAQAATIPGTINSLLIARFSATYTQTGTGLTKPYPLNPAPYVRVSAGGGPLAFQDASGSWWQIDPTVDNLEAAWFGVVSDIVTDDTSPLQLAANNASFKVLHIRGVSGVSSRINLSTGTTVQGHNNRFDGFIVIGSNVMGSGILYMNNISNVKIDSLFFSGNLIEPVAFSTGAIRIDGDELAITNMTNFQITNNYFINFKTTEWIGVYQHAVLANTIRIEHINISNNTVISVAQCATTIGQSGFNGNTFVRMFANTVSNTITTGDIANVIFANNTIDGLGLAGAFLGFGPIHGVTVTGNVTLNMGNNSIPEDRTYTYLFYNSGPTTISPSDVVISGNTGYGHHNNAVYLVGTNNATISGNSFDFIYAGEIGGTLPWGGAIALNGTRNISVTGNTLVNGVGGIWYSSLGDRADTFNLPSDTTTISGNCILNTTAGTVSITPFGITLSVAGQALDSVVNVTGNAIKVTGANATGIRLAGGTGNFGNVLISSNLIETGNAGISTSGTISTRGLTVSNNVVFGTILGYAIDLNVTTGQLFMTNNTADFSQVIAGSSGGVRISGPDCYINGLVIYKKTNGNDAFTTNGATGTLQNVSFPKTTSNQITAGGLGYTTPTHLGKVGDFVQAINPSEAGTAGSKYVVVGWVNLAGSTTWTPQRMLTGN